MGRLIKCQAKNCRNGGKVDTDEAFVYYHYTKKGNLQKRNIVIEMNSMKNI